jgi:plastocyanin
MKKRLAMLMALVFALALVAAACGGNEGSSGSTGGETEGTSSSPSASESGGESEGGQITIGSDQANDKGTKDVSGMDELELELDSFYFEPTVLKGTAGQSLKLELKNESTVEHNFTLEDQQIDQDVEGGEDATITVTFPSSGTAVFFCKYHRSSGMVGELST